MWKKTSKIHVQPVKLLRQYEVELLKTILVASQLNKSAYVNYTNLKTTCMRRMAMKTNVKIFMFSWEEYIWQMVSWFRIIWLKWGGAGLFIGIQVQFGKTFIEPFKSWSHKDIIITKLQAIGVECFFLENFFDDLIFNSCLEVFSHFRYSF